MQTVGEWLGIIKPYQRIQHGDKVFCHGQSMSVDDLTVKALVQSWQRVDAEEQKDTYQALMDGLE